MEVYEEHEKREKEPDKDASCAEVAAGGLGDALAQCGTLILQCLFKFADGFLCIVLGITDVVLEFVERLSLLLDEFI